MKTFAHSLLLLFWLLATGYAFAQTAPFALMPIPKPQFFTASGVPAAGGCVFTYAAGTTTPLATYVDSAGSTPNANPIVLNAGGYAPQPIWLSAVAYKIVLKTAGGSACATGSILWSVDNVKDLGALAENAAVLLAPAGGAEQDVSGPVGAAYFKGTTQHTTSTGVRVSLLDPVTTLDTATNPPNIRFANPALPAMQYNLPDPVAIQSNFILSPGADDWAMNKAYALNDLITPGASTNPCGSTFIVTTAGTSGSSRPTFSTLPCASSAATVADGSTLVWTTQGMLNQLDCTKSSFLTCKRQAYLYLEAAGCNSTTGALGWDTFGSNSPTPFCLTGTNVTGGIMGMPSASSPVQSVSHAAGASSTNVLTIPTATVTGHLLIAACAVDGSKTVSGIADGTNTYSLAVAKANGATDVEIWYMANSTGVAAAASLTVTLSGSANSACRFREYQDVAASAFDTSASSSGTGTAVSTGSFAGLAQAPELLIAAVGSPSNPTVTGESTWSDHGALAQSTNVTLDTEGTIDQSQAGGYGTFTLGTSQAWAAAIATFKSVTTNTTSQAQRNILLPTTFRAADPINVNLLWQQYEVGGRPISAAAQMGASLVCTAMGSTDDPAFNAATSATVTVPVTMVTTPLANLASTGCAAGSILHLQINRQRFNAADNFEGFVGIRGAGLIFGISQ